MKETINTIASKHRSGDIEVYEPATQTEISLFEQQIGFPLPEDFKKFYSMCNGFRCNDDAFNILPLSSIMKYAEDHGNNWFYFAEYMIYSDVWGLRVLDDGRYEIFNGNFPGRILTSSLTDFLNSLLNGSCF